MNENNLELTLKNDWDYFPHYSKEQGHFVGRTEEKNKVLNWFIRREKGCFLVSGERGVGKTALVYEALREASQKKTLKPVTPILISASQLISDECICSSPSVKTDDSEVLRNRIVVNLIRRLFTEAHSPKKDSKLSKQLAILYRKAVSTKAEIQENFLLEKSLENKKESEIETKIDWQVEHGQAIALAHSLGAIIGVVLLTSTPLWGHYAFNIILGLICVLCPKSAYFFIRNKAIEQEIRSKSSTIQEVYKQDRSISNLVHDLQDLLDKLAEQEKIIFIIDEVDKIDGGPSKEIELIKTFKNLFTLSEGLFVFITSQSTFTHIERNKEENGERGISYTLYTDKIFVTKPSFFDLEKYLDEIIYEPTNELLEKKEYHSFRNLLCYQAKSDFFELQYKVRDYITGYDEENRPILKIPMLNLEEILNANQQKMVGQIFDLNRFSNPSQWYMNNALLDSLYKLVMTPENRKELFKREKTKTHLDVSQSRIVKANENLFSLLSRLRYVTGAGKQDVDIQGSISVGFDFSWTGEVRDVPKRPDMLLEYEEDFLKSLKQYVHIINEITELDCLFKNKKLDVLIDGEEMTKENVVKTFCNLDVFAVYQSKLQYRNKLKFKPPYHFTRDELMVQITDMGNQIKQVYAQTATLTMMLIKNNFIYKNFSNPPKRFEHDTSLFIGDTAFIRQGVLKRGLVHDCIFKKSYSGQILIVQDMPSDFFNESRDLINSNASHHLIINLNTLKLKYDLTYEKNKDKKIKGFIDVPIWESFLNLKSVFEMLKKYDTMESFQDNVEKDVMVEA